MTFAFGSMGKRSAPPRAVVTAVALTGITALSHPLLATIFRWDNGQPISGTTGITPGPGVVLSSLNLSFANLASANLYSATMISTNLTSAHLSSATLSLATFTNANLTGATIDGANLSFATGLTSAQVASTLSYTSHNLVNTGFAFDTVSSWNFTSQNLTSASFYSATVTSAIFTNATILGTNFLGATGLTSAQIASTASYGAHNLTGIQLSTLDLTSWNFTSQNLTSASLFGCILTGTTFTNATVRFVDFTTATNFTSAQLASTASYINHDLTGISLDSVPSWNFTSQNLTSASFSGADVTGTTFTNATIANADFSFATNFTSAQLVSTLSWKNKNLTGISLGSDVVSSWNFASQNLTSADFTGATVTGATFTNATVAGALFNGAIGFTAAQLTSTASYAAHNLVGIGFDSAQGWNLASQNMTSAYLYSANLASANLTSATLDSSELALANLTSANLTSASLISADFDGATLTSTNLTFADLRGAINFVAAGSTILRGTILPPGTLSGFTLNAGETFRIRAGNPVSLTGAITAAATSNIILDSGAFMTSGPTFTLTNGVSLQINGAMNSLSTTTITLNGGTLSGSGSITGTVQAGSGAHTIAPSATLPAGVVTTLTMGGLNTDSNTTISLDMISPGNNDALNITTANALTLNGGKIQFANTPSGASSLGYYKIIQYNGAIMGAGLSSLTLPTGSSAISYYLDTQHDPGFIDLHRGFIGDADNSGTVDLTDLTILASNWQKSGTWAQGDFNHDGFVDLTDLTMLAQNWQSSMPIGLAIQEAFGPEAAEILSVPEPAAIATLLPATILLARRRRTATSR